MSVLEDAIGLGGPNDHCPVGATRGEVFPILGVVYRVHLMRDTGRGSRTLVCFEPGRFILSTGGRIQTANATPRDPCHTPDRRMQGFEWHQDGDRLQLASGV